MNAPERADGEPSVPRPDEAAAGEPPLLEARALRREFPVRGSGGLLGRRRQQVAVDGVSMQLQAGEMVALVGESGSGKSTLGRMLLGLAAPTAGQVYWRGQDIAGLRDAPSREFRREVQVVFQDTGASLNPRRSIGQSIGLPLRHNRGLEGTGLAREVDELLDQVGLPPGHFRHRLPHELSGGQRQRVGIARALASRPAVIVADEPVSALDVSVRAQILRLLYELQQARRLACLFITHDLGVVRAMADRVLVMHRGRVVESAGADALFEAPRHAYTQRLLAATPVPDPARQRRGGTAAPEAVPQEGAP